MAEPTEPTDPTEPSEQTDDARRRTFVPGLVVGIGTAALLAVAGNQAWVRPAGDSPTGVEGKVAGVAADASSPLTTAIALVVLACWGVLLVTRGAFRRVIAWFGAVVALALVLVVALGWQAAPGDLAELMATYGIAAPEVSRTPWCWIAAVTAPFALAAALLAVRDVGSWPQMGSRYDAPGGETDATDDPATTKPTEEQSHRELWNSLDEGEDPTR